MIAETHIATEKSAVYMKQLCRHFGHKAQVEFTDERGSVLFPFGSCTLQAEPSSLVLKVEADDADNLSRLKQVVGSHLERFAFRETLRVEWPEQTA